MGNSEVGHMNIGAGRKVLQHFVRINKSIEDQSFFETPELVNIMAAVSKQKSIHLMGFKNMDNYFAVIEQGPFSFLDSFNTHGLYFFFF